MGIKKYLAFALIGLTMIIGTYCHKDKVPEKKLPINIPGITTPIEVDKPKNYTLNNFTKITLGNGYEKPQGLSHNASSANNSVNKNIRSLVRQETISPLEKMIFAEAPIFNSDGSGYLISPKIYQNTNGNIEVMCDLSDKLDKSVFDTSWRANTLVDGEIGAKPQGLIINTALLKDGSVLLLTNISNEIYRFYKDENEICQGESFIKNIEVEGTTGTHLSTDDKLYLAQTIIFDGDNNVVRPKRIRSIDVIAKTFNEIITELPDGAGSNSMRLSLTKFQSSENTRIMPIDALIKYVQNSEEGLAQSGYKGYISDLFNGIYGIDANNQPVLIASADNITLPIAISTTNNGELYGITSPLYSEDRTSFIPPELVKINPVTGEISSSYFTFTPTNVSDYDTGGRTLFNKDGQIFNLSMGFDISLTKKEDLIKTQFFFTNTNTKEISELEAIKDYAPTISIENIQDKGIYDEINAPTEISIIVNDQEDNINECWSSSDNGVTKETFNCVNEQKFLLPINTKIGTNDLQIGANNIFSDNSIGNETTQNITFTVNPSE